MSAATATRAAGHEAPASAVTLGPLISGSSALVNGTAVWTDYAYDDTVTAPPGMSAGGLPVSAPDALRLLQYPKDVPGGNAADLIQLQVGLRADAVHVRAVLETLTDPTVPLVGLGIDRDRRPGTGCASIPGGTWKPGRPLGLDYFVALASPRARLLRCVGGSWRPLATFAITVDARNNVLEATVPARLLPAPRSGSWDLVAVAGLARAGETFLDGSGSVYDLGYVDEPGPPTGWQDTRQSAVFGGSVPPALGAGIGRVDWSAVRAHRTSLPRVGPGMHTLLYHSALSLPEGIRELPHDTLGTNAPFGVGYLGPYQPYIAMVPKPNPMARDLIVFLHGSGANHTAQVSGFTGSFSTGATVVFPFGRGTNYRYESASERDVLEVADDAIARLRLDRDRVVLSGISQGGIGTVRIGELYPDRFAGLFPIVGSEEGYGMDKAVLNAPPAVLPENLTAVPLRMSNGTLDPLVSVATQALTNRDLEEVASVDYRSYMFFDGTHLPQAATNCVFDELLARPRDLTPPRVRYTVDPTTMQPDPVTGLRLRYTGAYWVSGMAAAGAGKASVDAVSLNQQQRKGTSFLAVGENISHPRDVCGDNPKVQTRDAWRTQGRFFEPDPTSGRGNGLRVTLRNVRAVTFDLTRSKYRPSARGILALDADTSVTVTLRGLRPGSAVLVPGASAGHAGPSGVVRLTLARGTRSVILNP